MQKKLYVKRCAANLNDKKCRNPSEFALTSKLQSKLIHGDQFLMMRGAAAKIFLLPHLSPRVKFIPFKKDELFFHILFRLYLRCAYILSYLSTFESKVLTSYFNRILAVQSSLDRPSNVYVQFHDKPPMHKRP